MNTGSIQSLSTSRKFQVLMTLILMSAMVILGGCSSSPKRYSATNHDESLFPGSAKQTHTQKRLTRHFRNWQRTPYRLGGMSKSGIDCSGFVHLTYRDVFNQSVPRTTKHLAKYGKHISQNNLRLGDLVFFKTGRKQRHVGIYIGRGNFIHASTSKGVMQSKLDSSYWKKHFWMAKRVLS